MPFESAAPPASLRSEDASALHIFLGSAVALGAFENCYGDAHALVRRDVLEALGGFTEDFGSGHEDWEFFARAALAGHEILSVPEPLFWYRIAPNSMARGTADRQVDLRRGLRPYAALLPPSVRPALLAAISEADEATLLRREITGLRVELTALVAEIRDASDQIAASTSLKLTKPLREAMTILRQQQPDSPALVPLSARQEFAQLLRLLTSSSWDLAAPARLIARFVHLFLRAP
jgi:O-antigen biosynthesis protein